MKRKTPRGLGADHPAESKWPGSGGAFVCAGMPFAAAAEFIQRVFGIGARWVAATANAHQ
jgi:hypothetical protein